MTIETENRAAEIEGLFAQAADRCRAQSRYENGERFDMPLGVVHIHEIVLKAMMQWRELTGLDLSGQNYPEAFDGEPEGLSEEMQQLYREFRAGAAELAND